MEGTDVAGKAFDALLTQSLGPVCVLLVIGICGLFFIYRKDIASRDKTLAEARAEHLRDVQDSSDKVFRALDILATITTPKRPRGGG